MSSAGTNALQCLFLTKPPNGQPAALLRSDAFTPLIVFEDAKTYRPQAVRRVMISKPGGG